MSRPSHLSLLRPPPALRIGVTGPRRLAPEAAAALRVQVGALLDIVVGALPVGSVLRLISPLAEGVDRLVAEEATVRDWRIIAPLPFSQAEYELDFPETVAHFRDLLADAEVLELDGDRRDPGASYEAAGQFVVRNCDLLVAVWDGEAARGRGGTGEIVRFAAHGFVPVWWLAVDGATPPRLIRKPSDLRQPTQAQAGDAALASLRSMLWAATTPPTAPPPDRPGTIGRLVATTCRWAGRADNPLDDYLKESAHKNRKIWRLYNYFMDTIAPAPTPGPAVSAVVPQGPVETYWEGLRAPADGLSNAYGDRYRSCYLLIFALAASALVFAALGLAFPHTLDGPMTMLELAALVTISLVVAVSYYRRFHENWISCRLLAELCRKQLVLAGLGWSLPHWEVERLASDEAQLNLELPRDAWVAWYFSAARRAAPLPTGQLTTARIARSAALGRILATEQISYHQIRRERSETAGRRLEAAGEAAFLATLGLVALKLPLLAAGQEPILQWMTLLCLALSAASAAFVGIRAYAEFELLSHQSARMQRELTEIAAELASPVGSEPLASEAVGMQLFELAMAMLRDVRGWAQLFRMKAVGSG